MKKLSRLIVVFVLPCLLLIGCDQPKVIDYPAGDGTTTAIEFKPYGLLDPQDRNPDVEYRVVDLNIVLSAVLIETIFVPVILLGWHLYEPVRYVGPNAIPGAMSL